jgi:hypothetical protein
VSSKTPETNGKRASRLGATLAVLFAFVVTFALPNRYFWGPKGLESAAGIVLLVLFSASAIGGLARIPRRIQDGIVVVSVLVLTALNILSLLELIRLVIYHAKDIDALKLLASSVAIWIGNVIAFGLVYWLMDGGGPDARLADDRWRADFVFPQPVRPADIDPGWRPGFMDYAFLAFCTATAFSPTDTLPLTTRARVLMMVESAASLITIAIAAARAVNILS